MNKCQRFVLNSVINEGYNECKSKFIVPYMFSQIWTADVSLEKDAQVVSISRSICTSMDRNYLHYYYYWRKECVFFLHC